MEENPYASPDHGENSGADSTEASSDAAPRRNLTLFDSTCIIVGIIIGAGIYTTSPQVAAGAGSAWGVLLIWTVGGLLSLFGAFQYAELATAYPKEGGDYVYLTRAYGRWAGFLFGWIQLVVVRPGDIAVMAFVFAIYAQAFYDPLGGASPTTTQILYAQLAVIVLAGINIWGVQQGKWTQNFLTVVKAIGLLGIIAVAMVAPRGAAPAVAPSGFPVGVALILVLFTFGGWNEMAYVAAEVKNPKRNIVRALIFGTVSVTILYLMLNIAFLYTLGYPALTNSGAVAVDVVSTIFSAETGGRVISALVCISALGAVNGLTFTGARISYAVGADHRAFRLLGKWNPKTGTPVRALVLQATLAVVLIGVLGSFVDSILYAAAAVYLFYLSTSLAVIILRAKEPDVERPYRATGYPFTTLIFCAVCGYLIYGAISYKPLISGIALGLIAVGFPLYWLTTPRGDDAPSDERTGGETPAD